MAEDRALAPGTGTAPAAVLSQPLSLWGGVDPATGTIVERRHPDRGRSIAGRILVMRSGRGSSSSSTVLAECIRAGTAPVAVVLAEADPILAIGSVVAAELYGVRVPVVVLGEETFDGIADGDDLDVIGEPDGSVRVVRSRTPRG